MSRGLGQGAVTSRVKSVWLRLALSIHNIILHAWRSFDNVDEEDNVQGVGTYKAYCKA